MKKYITTILLLVSAMSCYSQEKAIVDTIIKANGEIVNCLIKKIENDKVQYMVGGKFLTTTYLQRLSEIKFSDGTSQFIQPVLTITDQDWEKVIVTSNPDEVKNLFEKGFIETNNQGSAFSNKQKLIDKSIEQLKKESAKLGAHIILITSSNNQKGNIEWDGDLIIGIRSGSQLSGIAYGF